MEAYLKTKGSLPVNIKVYSIGLICPCYNYNVSWQSWKCAWSTKHTLSLLICCSKENFAPAYPCTRNWDFFKTTFVPKVAARKFQFLVAVLVRGAGRDWQSKPSSLSPETQEEICSWLLAVSWRRPGQRASGYFGPRVEGSLSFWSWSQDPERGCPQRCDFYQSPKYFSKYFWKQRQAVCYI